MSEFGPIDHGQLSKAQREMGTAFPRILSYYAEDGERSVAEIENAVRGANAAGLVRPAHTLKGESLQFGAAHLGMLAEKIEMAGRQAVEDRTFPADMVAEAARLRPLFHEAINALRQTIVAPPAPVRRAPGGFGRKTS
ncbi:Hpt domain-containing protein [Sphingomonas nostoxanthinifaciens]|uniref:Hpt domain-containing protein n=1 Tax=Sphingomonas nostoxanthinifaciens TaxID=2872652 RepID=UPI001CC20CF8|nr:Hpt domain-containing protein [Sphingomonas nostoxanthinifaciens]